MTSRTKEDFWAEMAVREVSTHAHFSRLAFASAEASPGDTDRIFLGIHTFLSCAGVVSKLLVSKYAKSGTTVGALLGVEPESIVHNRKLRDNFEHYYERLVLWINAASSDASFGTYNVGPKSMIRGDNFIFVRHYDPGTKIFTFVNEDFDLGALLSECSRIQALADGWLRSRGR